MCIGVCIKINSFIFFVCRKFSSPFHLFGSVADVCFDVLCQQCFCQISFQMMNMHEIRNADDSLNHCAKSRQTILPCIRLTVSLCHRNRFLGGLLTHYHVYLGETIERRVRLFFEYFLWLLGEFFFCCNGHCDDVIPIFTSSNFFCRRIIKLLRLFHPRIQLVSPSCCKKCYFQPVKKLLKMPRFIRSNVSLFIWFNVIYECSVQKMHFTFRLHWF